MLLEVVEGRAPSPVPSAPDPEANPGTGPHPAPEGGKCTRPSASVVARPNSALLRASSATLAPATGFALAWERTKTSTPSGPRSVLRPRSVTTSHWVAGVLWISLSGRSAGIAVST